MGGLEGRHLVVQETLPLRRTREGSAHRTSVDHDPGCIHVSMECVAAKAATKLGLGDPVFLIDVATACALLGTVGRFPVFDHNAMGGFQSLERQLQIPFPKP